MLTGKLVRVRVVKNRVTPVYLDPANEGWLRLAEQLLFAYRTSVGRTRGEIAEDLTGVVGEGPQALVHQGLAKLLEDRCEFEVTADHPPDELRETVFRVAAQHRAESGRTATPFDRSRVLDEVGQLLTLDPKQIEFALFADLRDEQRVLDFGDCSPEFLLDRYNVALAQAVLLRCSEMEVRVWGETPARFRQLFRAVKFHRLICTITATPANSYTLKLDGPLSLFSSTLKYGLQLALFLPTLLHFATFELKAQIRWGAERKEKAFSLSSSDGLRSPAPDFGTYTPPELRMFADSFTAKVKAWLLTVDPSPIPLGDGIWVPDFTLTHLESGKIIFVEVFGFWRKADIERVYQRLKKPLSGRFLLCMSEQYRADEAGEAMTAPEVYRYKRTPLPEEVARLADALSG